MKKIMILSLCTIVLFVGANALADEIICGRADVLWLNLWESDPATDVPVQSCDVWIRFVTENNQGPCDVWIRFVTENNQGPYTLPATAFGTQINLALLKALNYQENVSACLVFIIIPPNEFEIRIRNIDFEVDEESSPEI
jgi:hypothetical protein